MHRIDNFNRGCGIRSDIDNNQSTYIRYSRGATDPRVDERDLQSRTGFTKRLRRESQLRCTIGVQIRNDSRCRFAANGLNGCRFSCTDAKPKAGRRNERTGQQIDVGGESQGRSICACVVSYLLRFEGDVVGIANRVGGIEQLIEIRIFGTACGRISKCIVLDEQFLAVEVDDDRVTFLFQYTSCVSHNRLRNHRSDLRSQINSEFDRVLTRILQAWLEQISIGVSQSSDAELSVVKAEDFEAICIIREVFCKTQGDFIFVRAITDDHSPWGHNHIIALGKVQWGVGRRVCGSENRISKATIDLGC